MKTVGFIGWRGMVGSVLLHRMQQENDFAHIEPVFFSTSNAGGNAPARIADLANRHMLRRDRKIARHIKFVAAADDHAVQTR